MRSITLTISSLLLIASSVAMAAVPASTASTTSAPGANTTRAPNEASTIAVAPATTVSPEPRQVLIGRTVVQVMQAHHYPAEKLNDKFVHALLKQYFDALDPGRFYFTQSMVDKLTKKYAGSLEKALKHGNLKAPFAIYKLYVKQAHKQLHYALHLLEKKQSFDGDQTFRFSRRHVPWVNNRQALDTLWQERVTNDLLSLVLSGKSQNAAKKALVKRYRYSLNHINRTTSNDVFETWLNAYAQTEDPHSSYFSPFDAQQFQIQMSLQLEGIGAQLSKHGNFVTVVRVLPGGPAAKSKALDAGDRIVAVGEGEKGKMQDVIGWRLDDVVKLIRGKKGSTVRLKILPAGALPGESEKTLSLTRDTIELNAERASAKIQLVKADGHAYRIGIITIPSFYVNFQAEGDGDKQYTSVSRDVRTLLKALKKKKVSGILLDLRNNGGGSLQEALALSGLFVPDGPVVQVQERNGNTHVLDTPRGEKPVWNGPLALLINRFSASATEIFSGAMKDYHRGLIIGSRTWGKGTVQQLIKLGRYLPGFKSGELKLTTAQFFRINGSSTQHRGVRPQLDIPNAVNDDKFGESSFPNALPWKKIDTAEYSTASDGIDKLLPKLEHYYDSSVKKGARFKLYLQSVDRQRKQNEQKKVSLNIKTRKTKRDERRARELRLANAWRKLDGKPGFKTLEAADKAQFSPPDIPLDASADILSKYIDLAPRDTRLTAMVHKLPASALPGKQVCMQLKDGDKVDIGSSSCKPSGGPKSKPTPPSAPSTSQ
jgi:carboxyl-terminal processing protease